MRIVAVHYSNVMSVNMPGKMKGASSLNVMLVVKILSSVYKERHSKMCSEIRLGMLHVATFGFCNFKI